MSTRIGELLRQLNEAKANIVSQMEAKGVEFEEGESFVDIGNKIKNIAVDEVGSLIGFLQGAISVLKVPHGVTSLRNNLMQNDRNLEKAILPTTLETIPLNCFSGCTKLTDINLENVKVLNTKALNNTGVAIVNLPNVETVDNGALADCSSLTHVYLGENVTSVSNTAFSNSNNLQEIHIAKDGNNNVSLDGTVELPLDKWGNTNVRVFWANGEWIAGVHEFEITSSIEKGEIGDTFQVTVTDSGQSTLPVYLESSSSSIVIRDIVSGNINIIEQSESQMKFTWVDGAEKTLVVNMEIVNSGNIYPIRVYDDTWETEKSIAVQIPLNLAINFNAYDEEVPEGEHVWNDIELDYFDNNTGDMAVGSFDFVLNIVKMRARYECSLTINGHYIDLTDMNGNTGEKITIDDITQDGLVLQVDREAGTIFMGYDWEVTNGVFDGIPTILEMYTLELGQYL